MSGTKQSKVSAGKLEVRTVRSSGDRRRFLDLPYKLYKGDPYWVAPLRIAQKDILDTERHPFYKTAEVEMFLAERDRKVVGRIMAILNHAHNEFHNERAGFFGFFEVTADYQAAEALFDAASDWLRSRGAVLMRGPVNPSTNYELGLLVEGFDLPPTLMMPYNRPYYADLVERYGLRKAMDLYSYFISYDTFIVSEKLKRVAERFKKRESITVRSVNIKNFDSEVALVRRIYNDAWSDNWGFVPVTEQEFSHLAKDLKQLVDPRVVMVAEQIVDGADPRPIGFFLAVPDINRALKKLNGRLLPFGLAKLLWYSRKIDFMRIITMGVIKEYQNLGVAALFYDEIYRLSPLTGYLNGEMSWVLENNLLMNRAAELIGGRKVKTHRIYEVAV